MRRVLVLGFVAFGCGMASPTDASPDVCDPHVRILENLAGLRNVVEVALPGNGLVAHAAAIGATVRVTAAGVTQAAHGKPKAVLS